MNKLIMLIGGKETGKDSIVDVVMQGYSKSKLLKFIRMDNIIQKELGNFKSIDWNNIEFIEKLRERIHISLEKEIIECFKNGKDVVLEGYFAFEIDNGYIPVLSGNFFDAIKPTAFIFYELHINKKIPRKREDIEKLLTLEKEQDVNKHYASVYSSVSGSLLKIIKVKDHGVKQALKETRDVINFALGG